MLSGNHENFLEVVGCIKSSMFNSNFVCVCKKNKSLFKRLFAKKSYLNGLFAITHVTPLIDRKWIQIILKLFQPDKIIICRIL